MNDLIQELLKFRNERDWEQFHNPKDLALAINVEAGELLEQYLWKSAENANTEKVKHELADILIYAIFLADKYGWKIDEIIREKMKLNSEKYPIDKAKGNAMKYNEF
jgi:NTP pyrophosphatase (non-canonical NTP hydrolase)